MCIFQNTSILPVVPQWRKGNPLLSSPECHSLFWWPLQLRWRELSMPFALKVESRCAEYVSTYVSNTYSVIIRHHLHLPYIVCIICAVYTVPD